MQENCCNYTLTRTLSESTDENVKEKVGQELLLNII